MEQVQDISRDEKMLESRVIGSWCGSGPKCIAVLDVDCCPLDGVGGGTGVASGVGAHFRGEGPADERILGTMSSSCRASSPGRQTSRQGDEFVRELCGAIARLSPARRSHSH